jgi:hypothetical protein
MVRVTTVPNAFQARVVAARLGSEGIIWELRGNVDGPYPVGAVEVFVAEADHEAALELLRADEAAFADEDGAAGDEDTALRATPPPWLLLAVVIAVALFAVVRMVVQA